MEEKKNNSNINDEKKQLGILVEEEFADTVKKALAKNYTKDEIDEILKETKESINYTDKIKEIDLSDDSNRVIFTDGEEQLVYINGEFFIVSTTDSTKFKKKKKKQEAKDMYLEYFIKYQLNPLLEQSKMNRMIKTISNETRVNDKDLNKKLKDSVKDEKSKVEVKKKRTKKIDKDEISR